MANERSPRPVEPVDARARRRLRELRLEQGLTLAEVGRRAAIDVSTLSRLESGGRRLALDHVPALAAALGVSADALLGSDPPDDPRVCAASRRFPGMTVRPLTERRIAGMNVHRVRLDASRGTPPDPLPVHAGHDLIHVLAGRLRLLLGESQFTILPGETVDFTTWTPHWFGVVAEPVELIMIVGQDGEASHLHS